MRETLRAPPPAGSQAVYGPLLAAGYECYLVGGTVRDLLLGRQHVDLDFTTNARPDALQRVFKHSHYTNRFGTVLVRIGRRQYEVTTYRGEGRYSDHRHPDEVAFVDRLEEDLQRRDFTINAMAIDSDGWIVDPFGGRADLHRRLIRAVGDPAERLREDPLRMMRAARLATQLDCVVEPRTRQAIVEHAAMLSIISRERVRDELLKLLASPRARDGVELLEQLHLLDDALPELAALARSPEAVERDDYEHALQTLQHCGGDGILRLAALLHVLGDAVTAPSGDPPHPNPLPQGEGVDPLSLRERVGVRASTKPSHDREPQGADSRNPTAGSEALTRELDRLRLSNAEAARVRRLVAAIPSVPATLPADERSARRLLNQLGELLPDVLRLVRAHRLALDGARAENLNQLRTLRRLASQVQQQGQPVQLGDLAVTGDDIVEALQIKPGPRVGRVLNLLLERVLDDPTLNQRETLLEHALRADRRLT